MNFKTRPHFEDRQVVQYIGESVKLSGDTLYANTGGITIEPTILDFTGTTTAQTTVTIAGLTGYLNNNNRLSGLIINPPKLKLSGSTGTTTVNVENFVLKAIDANGTVGWQPISVSADTNTFVTGGTLTGTDLTLDWNTGGSANPIDLNGLLFTGNTSGSCITDLYITNLYGCSPITIHDSVQSVTSSATGTTSFAFGFDTKAYGINSYAGGNRTTANGDNSYAKGEGTVANGYNSYADGSFNVANGDNSYAGGSFSVANGDNSFIHSINSIITGNNSVLLGGTDLTGTTSDTVYVPNLTVRGNHILHSDSVLEVSDLPSTLENEIKGSFSSFDWSGLTASIINNSDTSGYTSFLLGDLSSYPLFNKYGFLSYYNSNYVRSGLPPTTGVNFYQDKLVLKSANASNGIIFSTEREPFWWESGGDSRMILSFDGNLGLGLNTDGTESPTEKLHVNDGDILVENTSGKFFTDIEDTKGPLVLISGGTSDLPRIGAKTPSSDSITMGVRGVNEVSFPGYGKQGDSFIYSSNLNNGINILSTPGIGTDDYIRFYAGQDANGTTPDLYIQGSGSTRGYVGINTDSPTNYLDINNTGVEGFRIRSSYTPSSSGDTNGEVGTITWDNNYIYVKTISGWGRTQLDFSF